GRRPRAGRTGAARRRAAGEPGAAAGAGSPCHRARRLPWRRAREDTPDLPQVGLTGPIAMELSRIRALRGPNRWTRHTALEILVACDEDERSIDSMPGIEQRLRERFPDLPEPTPAEGGDAVTMADLLEVTLLAL